MLGGLRLRSLCPLQGLLVGRKPGRASSGAIHLPVRREAPVKLRLLGDDLVDRLPGDNGRVSRARLRLPAPDAGSVECAPSRKGRRRPSARRRAPAARKAGKVNEPQATRSFEKLTLRAHLWRRWRPHSRRLRRRRRRSWLLSLRCLEVELRFPARPPTAALLKPEHGLRRHLVNLGATLC